MKLRYYEENSFALHFNNANIMIMIYIIEVCHKMHTVDGGNGMYLSFTQTYNIIR